MYFNTNKIIKVHKCMDLNVIYDVKIGLNLALHSLWYGVNTFKLFFLSLQKIYLIIVIFSYSTEYSTSKHLQTVYL